MCVCVGGGGGGGGGGGEAVGFNQTCYITSPSGVGEQHFSMRLSFSMSFIHPSVCHHAISS